VAVAIGNWFLEELVLKLYTC